MLLSSPNQSDILSSVSGYLNHERMAYTVEDAGKLLSLSRAQLYRLIDLREIETIKIGKSRRITSRQLEAFLLSMEQRGGYVPLQMVSATLRCGRNQ